MKYYKYIFAVLTVMLVIGHSAIVRAERIELKPTKFAAYKVDSKSSATSFSVYFDISNIPNSSRIDLAELRMFFNTDTLDGLPLHIFVYPVSETWSASLTTKTDSPSKADSLRIGEFVTAGSNSFCEVNITELVELWQSGDIDNNGLIISIADDRKTKLEAVKDGVELKIVLSVYYSK